MRKPAVLAHRTSSFSAPPNSRTGLLHCLNEGAQAVECDVTFTLNGLPMIWADDQEAVLRNGQELREPVRCINLKDVRHLQRKEKPEERIMSLDDIWVFLNAYPDIVVFFDVKFYDSDAAGHFSKIGSSLVQQVIHNIVHAAIQQGLTHRIGFTTFFGGVEMLKKVKEVEPRIHNNLIVIFPWSGVEKHFPYLDSLTIGWNRLTGWLWTLGDLWTRKLIDKARKANLKLYGGLANRPEDIDWLLKKEFDGIWTDNVLWARTEIENRLNQPAKGGQNGG